MDLRTIQSVRILIVEESSSLQARMVSRLREIPGVDDVTGMTNAKAALALVSAYKPDIVVMDVHTQNGTNLPLLRLMRARVPLVVVVTNAVNEHHQRECLKHGADFFFDKSREFERVVDVVVKLMR